MQYTPFDTSPFCFLTLAKAHDAIHYWRGCATSRVKKMCPRTQKISRVGSRSCTRLKTWQNGPRQILFLYADKTIETRHKDDATAERWWTRHKMHMFGRTSPARYVQKKWHINPIASIMLAAKSERSAKYIYIYICVYIYIYICSATPHITWFEAKT